MLCSCQARSGASFRLQRTPLVTWRRPLAYGHSCLEGENYVRGLLSVSEHSTLVIGLEFLRSGGKAFILGSGGVVIMDEKEVIESMRLVAKLEAESAAKRNQT